MARPAAEIAVVDCRTRARCRWTAAVEVAGSVDEDHRARRSQDRVYGVLAQVFLQLRLGERSVSVANRLQATGRPARYELKRAICLPHIGDINRHFDHPAVFTIEVPDPSACLRP